MRTTVELPDSLYRRVRALAAERGLRGFSAIVEEALADYLEREQHIRAAERVRAAEGAWSAADVEAWETAVGEAWTSWPTSRSSTRTS